jgi:hypothetical protein
MPTNIRRAWLTDSGEPVPDTDARLYNHPCQCCCRWYRDGTARHEGRFLCLECLDDVIVIESRKACDTVPWDVVKQAAGL